MTTAILILVGLMAGYVAGRAVAVGNAAERDMPQWKAACIGAALSVEATS